MTKPKRTITTLPVGVERGSREHILAMSVPEPNTGCWLWLGAYSGKKQNYGAVSVGGKGVRAHRASYEAFKDKIPEGLLVRHKCNNPACVNPDHLEVGTEKDNYEDSRKAGTNTAGERSGSARLNSIKVREIFLSGLTFRGLAKIYGVGESTITHIKMRRTWKDVTNEL